MQLYALFDADHTTIGDYLAEITTFVFLARRQLLDHT